MFKGGVGFNNSHTFFIACIETRHPFIEEKCYGLRVKSIPVINSGGGQAAGSGLERDFVGCH